MISPEEILRSKRALIVLMECYKALYPEAPPKEFKELCRDVAALAGLIRKIEKL